jgi:hypothetical protein
MTTWFNGDIYSTKLTGQQTGLVGDVGPRAWTGSWTGAPDNPSVVSAAGAMIRAICAASARVA